MHYMTAKKGRRRTIYNKFWQAIMIGIFIHNSYFYYAHKKKTECR